MNVCETDKFQGGGRNFAPFFAVALTMACLPSAFAGIKYWDNPAFRAYDVGDYVQDGLALHYDGIRNVGKEAAHDSTATTWKNLGTSGATYDMVRKGSPSTSYWSDKGFCFEGTTWFVTPNKFSIPTKYEAEALVTAAYTTQPNIGYVLFTSTAYPRAADGGWAYASIAIRQNKSPYNQTIDGTAYAGKACFNTTSANTAYRPALLDDSYTYLTALANGTYACLFTGLEEPTDVPSRIGLASGKTALVGSNQYLYLGGHNTNGGGETSTGEGLVGMMRNFRYYTSPLTVEQRTWNRVVDEARFFNRRASIPVTNVVVSVAIDGVADDHFALDAEGYTFTAPAQRTVAGKRYLLSGYTLEKWNGSAWGEATAGEGSSVTLSDTNAKVRLTWLYARPAGEGRLATYDVSDYVQDGLLLFYDGILNQGAEAAHSDDAKTWVNIGKGDGQDWTLSFTHKVARGDPGFWDSDGYVFKGYSDFQKMGLKITHPATYSIQTLIAASLDEQVWHVDGKGSAYVYATAWDKSSLAMRTYGSNPKVGVFYWVTLGDKKRPYVYNADERYSYATAVQDASAKTLAFSQGTTLPTSGDGYWKSTDDFSETSAANIFLGGFNANEQLMTGKLKFFRSYANKALTEAEIAQNRKVDEYRYFGRYTVTNILVQSTYSYLHGNEPDGPYEVVDSYTFTAPERMTAENGITYAPDGYIVETWDADFGWKGATAGTGNAYLYKTTYGVQRLTWKWKAVTGRRTAADYSCADLSPAGLELHYDSVFNAGADAARSTTASTWVNLGAAGASMNLSGIRANGDTSAWGAEKGYVYNGKFYFQSAVNTYLWGGNFTAQVLVDAKHADHTHASGNYIAASTWNRFGMQDYGLGKLAKFHVQGTGNGVYDASYPAADGIDYMTAIEDIDAKVDLAFPGAKKPTGGTATTGYRAYTTQLPRYSNYFRLGGWGGGNNGQGLTGTLYTFRYYDRVLTDEELVRNRNVDAARYFGELAVTNVLVAAGGGVQTEAGAYKVEGEWTFTATTVDDGRGRIVPVARHAVEELVDGVWTNKAWHDGASYTYTDGASPATVRLTWAGQPFGTTILLR